MGLSQAKRGATVMHDILDLEQYPLDALSTPRGQSLLEGCRRGLTEQGMFNLEGFLRPEALERCLAEVKPPLEASAFTHSRSHNIYFKKEVADVPPEHPALKQFETVNHTICADQIPGSIVCRIYEWPPLAAFLAAVTGKPNLYQMADPLARANVMAYREGEALNWHFDRSEFTTTLLLQRPDGGGAFQNRSGLRTEANPNYDGVARLLAGEDDQVETLSLTPGTLNVFKGKYTAHRVTPVEGNEPRIVAVYSYYETPGVMFSEAERVGFYGRAKAMTAN